MGVRRLKLQGNLNSEVRPPPTPQNLMLKHYWYVSTSTEARELTVPNSSNDFDGTAFTDVFFVSWDDACEYSSGVAPFLPAFHRDWGRLEDNGDVVGRRRIRSCVVRRPRLLVCGLGFKSREHTAPPLAAAAARLPNVISRFATNSNRFNC